MKSKLRFAVLGLAASAMTIASSATAASVRTNAGFAASTLAANDDGSTGPVAIGFSANFFGTTYSQLYVNNNGNVTFNGPLGTFTPFNLLTTGTPIIAPFFADVDTRDAGSLPVQYGASIVNGHTAFGVNWVDVGFFASRSNPLNSFQLVMIDRSDIGVGDFDFEFNYDSIGWETGEASGGDTNGLGGSSARAGWSNGTTTSYEIAGSADNGAFLDGGPNALNAINGTGRIVFQVRNGNVSTQPPSVPDGGSTLASLGLALGALGLARRKFMKN
jgi:hypothetical protein